MSSDSAGVPWSARSLRTARFDGDTGEAEPAVAGALAGWAVAPDGEHERAVVDALSGRRLLVAVSAVGGDMAVAVLTGRDGRRALPAFTGTAPLDTWRADARPVPVEAPRVALAAAAEGCDALVIDPAGPVPFEVRRTALSALAHGRPWVPAWVDPQVCSTVRALLRELTGVVRVVPLPPGRPGPELVVVLLLRPGLDAAGLAALSDQATAALAGDAVLAGRVDGIGLRLLPADQGTRDRSRSS